MNQPITSDKEFIVQTKAEQIKSDQGSRELMSLGRFMVAHFNTDVLSGAQRGVLAQLAQCEGVEINACIIERMSGRAAGLYCSVKGAYNLATFSVGSRGKMRGTLYHWSIKDTKISGRDVIERVKSHTGEAAKKRKMMKLYGI